MTRASRIFAILVAAVLVVGGIVYAVTRGGDGGGGGTTTTTGTPAARSGALVVRFAYSPEKEQLIAPLIARYNQESHEQGGRRVFVQGEVVASGAAADGVVDGSLKVALWSPASSFWGRLVNWRADRPLVDDTNPSLVRTPLVIAMWEPMARALGWPGKQLGWADLARLARSPRGWAAYGHPEWGDFKLGHTNPEFSTSGLSAVAAQYYSSTGKVEGLTLADVRDPKVRRQVRDIQRAVVHYGDTTLYFADQLAALGPGFASAVAMEEVTLLDYNLNKAKGGQRLAAIYPREGTFYSDNPLIALNAPWASPEQRAAAKGFADWLVKEVTPAAAAASYLRPAATGATPAAPITRANLVDPAQPRRALSVPSPEVLDAIRTAWLADRKPARIEVVLDTSGSMADEGKFLAAQRGLVDFLKRLQPQDEVGLTTFSDKPVRVAAPRPLRVARADLIRRVQGLFPDGGTALYDTALHAWEDLLPTLSRDRISAVVLLTDGQDTSSQTTLGGLTRTLRERGAGGEYQLRIFTIAYGSDADRAVLKDIAAITSGRAYEGDPDTIAQVYKQISSFF